MNELTIYSLLQILASNSFAKDVAMSIDGYVKELLIQQVPARFQDEIMDFYVKCKNEYKNREADNTNKNSDYTAIEEICTELRKKLDTEERIIITIKLLEILPYNFFNPNYAEFANYVSNSLKVSINEHNTLKSFVTSTTYINIKHSRLAILKGGSDPTDTNELAQRTSKLNGEIHFLQVPTIQVFLMKYLGTDELFIDEHEVVPEMVYMFHVGSTLSGDNISPIFYSDLVSLNSTGNDIQKVVLTAENLEYSYRLSKNGIKQFSISEESGQLIGIMGGSGVGKSTLLNLLTGKQKPNKGRVLINGYDINTEKPFVQGIIGFVPQDDLLFESLTVYQNMIYNARLCFGNYSEKQIKELVNQVLEELELSEIKHLKVGSTLSKVISGGQRKRLNIALELLREPTILFVDEPTSGLSSSDSLMVMRLLKAQADKGKLVIVNIHQPSDKIFRLMDKLWVMDKGGYPIYTGNAMEAINYFRLAINPNSVLQNGCTTCGHINPDQILEIVEQKEVDENGKITSKRSINPDAWYKLYLEKIQDKATIITNKQKLPKNNFRLPNVMRQLKIFFSRNLLSRLANVQYVLLNVLEPIVLALILAFFVKYSSGDEYIFAENKNLPAYIFMSVIVSLFIGLMVSAEEIIGDRKVLERESFLNLSKFSYINSKILYLFLLSALQMFLFVAIGNTIMEVKGLTLQYWLVLFSTSFLSNIMGLIISSALNSVVAIYICIPFILVPQIMLSGTVVDFDNLHPALTRKVYVPLIGDMMPSRWSFEALAVEQYCKNKFERNFFDYDQKISEANFRTTFLIPRLQAKLDDCQRLNSSKNVDEKRIKRHLNFIASEIKQLVKFTQIPTFEYINEIQQGIINDDIYEELSGYLFFLKNLYSGDYKTAQSSRNEVYSNMVEKLGSNGFYHLKQQNHNTTLANWVLRNNEVTKYLETSDRIIQKYEPIYMKPDNPIGRSHFYAPYKYFNGLYIRTFWFNIVVIWAYSILLYTLLQMNFISRISKLAAGLKKELRK